MLGSQSVTIRNFTSSSRDRLNQPVKTTVDVVVVGCSMQPASVSESVTLTDVETELWKLYCPAVSAAVSATTASEVLYNGMTFQVLGTQLHVDLNGNTDHVMADLKKQIA